MSKKSQKKVEPVALDGVLSAEEREESIRLTAYYRWKKKGERYGEDQDDWFEAEEAYNDSFPDAGGD
ncbi:DUF2934 domain-containing protein [Pelodictyon phaeoclathratiforme]|jgi:hypothetical protein|uniref:DUF2934 domain-containing protein n=1 Tax=Pelodictyon phaeoclathratiforme (strain DSM 5477 / BU-1) TaxID=324925 RepID=B4SEH5_PELPB|nr:DUF2934 domain-containing protein [Pelodictyon phaeoclathratiforme]ACF43067.1 conserved hypothetical protein [Pelodictyon phaeoclathratiforme BU-1]MBV5289189.1 DUF2934 domain-containing protein [Pelodictyon phaeoclathratiforme]